eukprot:15485829-Alexandrium_andersonii.AAC.1
MGAHVCFLVSRACARARKRGGWRLGGLPRRPQRFVRRAGGRRAPCAGSIPASRIPTCNATRANLPTGGWAIGMLSTSTCQQQPNLCWQCPACVVACILCMLRGGRARSLAWVARARRLPKACVNKHARGWAGEGKQGVAEDMELR